MAFALLIAALALILAMSAVHRASRRADALERYAQELWRELDGRIRGLQERIDALQSVAPVGEPAAETTATPAEEELPVAAEVPPPPAQPLQQPVEQEAPIAAFSASAESLPGQLADAGPGVPPDSSPEPRSTIGERVRGFDWEGLVGVKLFSWIAGIALVIGGVLFLRYSIEHGRLTPPIRMTLGFITGLTLLFVSELRIANRYRVTANAMDGAAIAILYATTYAAHALWGLIGGGIAFVLMIGITAAAVFLSIRRDSAFIALLGLIGGFSTPALLSSGENRPVILFSYLLLVNAAVAWIAHRKRWMWLTLLSVGFTVFYQWAWVARFLDPAQLPFAVSVFLVFPIFTVLVYLFTTRSEEPGGGGAHRFAASASALVPLLFTVYVAVVPAYGARFHLLFGVLLVVRLALAAVSLYRPALVTLHRIGAITSLAVVLLWVNGSWTAAAWPDVLLWLAALVAVDVVIPVVRALRGVELTPAERQAALLGALQLAIFPMLPAIEPATSSAPVFFGALATFALLLSYAAWVLRQSSLYVAAAVIAFTAQWQWGSEFFMQAPMDALVAWSGIGVLFLLAPGVSRAVQGRMNGADADQPIVPHLGIQAYVLLLAAAVNPDLFATVIPILAALAVLLGAAAVASRVAGDARLLAPATIFTNLLLIVAIVTVERNRADAVVLLLAFAILTALVVIAISATARERVRQSFTSVTFLTLLAAEATLVAATMSPVHPSVIVLSLAHLIVISGILVTAARSGRHRVAVLGSAAASLAVLAWYASRGQASDWRLDLLLGTVAWIPFVIYPFAAASAKDTRLAPYGASIVASAWYFFYARAVLVEGGYRPVIGLLPLALAAVMGLVLRHLLHHRAEGERASTRLATVAATVLGFITIAIPLQFDREWVTLGFLAEAAALAWLFTRIPHRGLLLWSAALYAVGFLRLAINPAVYRYYERSDTPILNWYFYTYLAAAALCFAGNRILRGVDESPIVRKMRRLLPAAGTVLLFILVNIEVADYYSNGRWITSGLRQSLAQDLTYTIAWALFAIAMLVSGIALQNRGARIASIGLLAVTILKCFLYDLGQLGGLYRVGAFLGLAISLAAVALLLQRFVLRRDGTSPDPPKGEVPV